MRSCALVSALCCLPGLAVADACRDEIVALMQGVLDPMNRPPHIQTTVVYNPDGSVKWDLVSLVETPLRTISGQPSSNWFTMAIDTQVWNGPSAEGPWTASAAGMPEGRAEAMAEDQLEMIASLTDTECLGPDDAGNTRYVYRAQTMPDETGAYFGSLDTVTVDAASGQVILFDRTEFVNSWSEGVSMERWVSEVVFDDAVKVNPPE